MTQKNDISIQEQFDRFHGENPRVYLEIVEFIKKLHSNGHRHYSMDAILHVVRYHRHIRTTDKDFKINNNYSSRYARLVMDRNPNLIDFFHTRELKSK